MVNQKLILQKAKSRPGGYSDMLFVFRARKMRRDAPNASE
jgi:hypothetical protein